MVKRAAIPAFKVFLVVEDAGTVMHGCFTGPILLLDPTFFLPDIDVLPQVAIKFFDPASYPLLVLLLGEMGSEGAAAGVGGIRVDTFAAAAENTGPARGQPG